jgi:hypothetical protein
MKEIFCCGYDLFNVWKKDSVVVMIYLMYGRKTTESFFHTLNKS